MGQLYPAGIGPARAFYNENLSPRIPRAAALGWVGPLAESSQHPGILEYRGDAITAIAVARPRINRPGVAANARIYQLG